MNDKFNGNEVRIDCNGNVIDRPFLYDYNETMKLLGKQTYSWLIAPNYKYNKEFEDIINAHFNCDKYGSLAKSIRSILYDFILDFFVLGVIVGTRIEREKKQEKRCKRD